MRTLGQGQETACRYRGYRQYREVLCLLVAQFAGHQARQAIPLEKVAIFVDVQNVYYTAKQAFGRNFDYNAFWKAATLNREVVKATAYAIDRNDEKQMQFQNILRAIGFEVKLKPFIRRADGSTKGDWDVGITVDVMDHAESADVVILVTGDGDFDRLVERIKDKYRVTVEVYGVEQLTAISLIRSASRFVPIENKLLMGPQ